MNWKYKALLQQVLSLVPLGQRINYLLQRHVTRGCPRPAADLDEAASLARAHIAAARRHGAVPIERALFYEFGAGMDLAGPLIFWGLGVERQVVIDRLPLVRIPLVNDMLARLRRDGARLGLSRVPAGSLGDVGWARARAALLEHLGIDYRAPLDARSTGLADGSVDFVTSTNVMEHVPAPDIPLILRESRRLLRPGGLALLRVDYQDHYAYFDRRISVYNFLRFSPRAWAVFNPVLMYQNRLRHRDYVALARAAGLDVVEEGAAHGSSQDRDTVRAMPVAARFREYSAEELAVRTALLVLRRPVA